MPIIFKRGRIFFPPSNDAPKWRIKITKNSTVYTIADSSETQAELLGGIVTRRETDGLSDFKFSILSENRKYVDPEGNGCLFEEDDILDIFATYGASINENTDHIFRGFVDNAYMNMTDGPPSVEIEGMDYPIISSDETVIKSWTAAHILDVFIDRTYPTETADPEGNYEDGLLFNTGLILQFYDKFNANDWVIVKDLSSGDFNTLKTNISQEGVSTITKPFENQKHVTIAKEVVGNKLGWYVHYDKSVDVWYLRLFLKGSISNTAEHVIINQNWLTGPARFGINNDDVVKEVVLYGKTLGNIPIIRSSRDISYSGSRAKRRAETRSSLDTFELVQGEADSILEFNKTAPVIMDEINSLGLLSLKPGEKIPLSNYHIGISGDFIIPQFDFLFTKDGFLDCRLQIEVISETLGKQQKERIDVERSIKPFSNLSGMNNSIFFDFRSGEEEDFYIFSGMEIKNEVLILSDVGTAGTLTTKSNSLFNFTDNIIKVILRIEGSNLQNTTFKVSANNALNTQTITPGTLTPITTTGKNSWFKINAQNAEGISPQINRIGLLILTKK